ncbi:MAG: UDP-N-acetylmuramate dehydrogenase [Holosporales bacterium]|jgi:UDP-N-acetylmuramate dehydrogenase|nr:UDP-N-acetylmuramate dehydrogenase [Holosporales bacterium]
MLRNLPRIRGKYVFDYDFKEATFLRVGGKCDVVFNPMDLADLVGFLRNRPSGLGVVVIGNASNTIVLDGGVRGCVINLSRYMRRIELKSQYAVVEAGALLPHFINTSVESSVSSCEKLCGIPGTVGGAIAMNAGIPGFEISNALASVDLVDDCGTAASATVHELDMKYRDGNVPAGSIVTSAVFRTCGSSRADLENTVKELTGKRLRSQPLGATCGSAFKNPPNMKAWELIKESGCDRLSVGSAVVSDKHCNFLMNAGGAKASDFVKLIEIIKKIVFEKTGILLNEEIKIIGER